MATSSKTSGREVAATREKLYPISRRHPYITTCGSAQPILSLSGETIVITTSSGLQYEDLSEGQGAAAKAGDSIEVHYTGWLANGKKFDSSLDRSQPFAFQ